jgi:hypothetical protein
MSLKTLLKLHNNKESARHSNWLLFYLFLKIINYELIFIYTFILLLIFNLK